jgi:exosome complex RNA-binding protein Csl4
MKEDSSQRTAKHNISLFLEDDAKSVVFAECHKCRTDMRLFE